MKPLKQSKNIMKFFRHLDKKSRKPKKFQVTNSVNLETLSHSKHPGELRLANPRQKSYSPTFSQNDTLKI